MFYQKTDPNDPTAKLDDWYTNSDNYAACYNKANEKISFIAGSTCDKMTHGNNVSDSPAWKQCEAAQNSLKNTLNCSGTMFKKLDNRYYTQDDNKVNACKNNVQQAGNVQIVKSDGSLASAPAQGNPAGSAPGTNDSSQTKEIGCEFEVTSTLTWVLCPIINDILAPTVDAVDGWITSELNINTSNIFCTDKDTCNAFHSSWESFRNIALGLMVIAGLVIVISQALGMELLDAYTIRKTLPRVLIAAIGITLSWSLAEFAVQLSNDLGVGIRFLIYQPFVHLGNNVDLTFSHTIAGGVGNFFFGTAGLIAAAGATIILFGVILTMLGTAALAVFVAIVVLVLRQVAIILLILTAPIAIAAYILPNTQRVYKLWWDSFAKALMMFPIIAGFIAVGRVFSAVTLANNSSLLGQVIGFLAYFAPYFLIPATFRLAGGAIRQLGGFVNDRSKGAFDRLRQRRGRAMQQAGQDIKSGQALRVLGAGKKGGARDRINTGLQAASLAGSAGLNPRYWRGNVSEKMRLHDAQKRAGADNEEEMATIVGYDDLARAVTESRGDLTQMDAYLAERNYDEATRKQMLSAWEVARKGMAKKGYSHEATLQAVMLSGLKAKTSYLDEKLDYDEEGNYIGGARIAEDIAKLSGGNLGTMAQMTGKAADTIKAAGRQDELPGFSDTFDAVRELSAVSGKDQEEKEAAVRVQAKKMLQKSIYKEGLSAIVGGTAHATRNLIPVLTEQLAYNYDGLEAVKELNPADMLTMEVYDEVSGKVIEKSMTAAEAQPILQRQLDQLTAQVLSLQDVNGNLPPEKQAIVGDLLSREIAKDEEGKKVSVQDFVNTRRMVAQVNQFKADYQYGRREERGAVPDDIRNRGGGDSAAPPAITPIGG